MNNPPYDEWQAMLIRAQQFTEFTETAIVAVYPQRALRCPDFLMASYVDQEEDVAGPK